MDHLVDLLVDRLSARRCSNRNRRTDGSPFTCSHFCGITPLQSSPCIAGWCRAWPPSTLGGPLRRPHTRPAASIPAILAVASSTAYPDALRVGTYRREASRATGLQGEDAYIFQERLSRWLHLADDLRYVFAYTDFRASCFVEEGACARE